MHTPTFDELFGPALDRIAAQISKPWPAAFATLELESIRLFMICTGRLAGGQ
jgi:hypothetical protein